MSWTDERVEQLTKLWSEGLSASQIASVLGGVTRNAVIGKVHRLGLSGRSKPIRTSRPRPRKPRAPSRTRPTGRGYSSVGGAALKMDEDADAIAQPRLNPVPIEDMVIPMAERKSILELNEKTCRWPYHDPRDPDFHFCGRGTATDKPYCEHHSRLAYQPLNDRRRAQRR
ncbi:MAG: GcrA cell cycle regulator [Fimbriimonadaceae bacterium]|nr:GcrA cell cycle regulator [Alphaproteobacteria bacterium]